MGNRFKKEVPPELLANWRSRKRKSDTSQIATEIGVNTETISIAIRHGLATPEIMVAISAYFAKRDTPDELIEKAKRLLNI